MHVLVLAAYLLAAVLPVLSSAGTQQQTRAAHATMMAMAGHAAQMTDTDSPTTGAALMLCQQHCLSPAATLPVIVRAPERMARISDTESGGGLVARSLTIPPRGPPPKAAVI